MYLHLGGEVCIRIKDIVAIMDLETSSTSKITREFLRKIQKKGEVISVSDEDIPKSYVLIKAVKRCMYSVSHWSETKVTRPR